MDPDMLIQSAQAWLSGATAFPIDDPLRDDALKLAQMYATLAVYARLDGLCDRLDALAARFAL